jgi:hypothetical protein
MSVSSSLSDLNCAVCSITVCRVKTGGSSMTSAILAGVTLHSNVVGWSGEDGLRTSGLSRG